MLCSKGNYANFLPNLLLVILGLGLAVGRRFGERKQCQTLPSSAVNNAAHHRQVIGMAYSEENPYTWMEYEAQACRRWLGHPDTFNCLRCHRAWWLEGLQDLLELLCNPRYGS